jgi:superfamily II DNA or RNA helicase
MAEWVLPTNKGLQRNIEKSLAYNTDAYLQNQGSCDDSEKVQLFEHQNLVSKLLSSESPYRGLLLYHSLGSGKSCSAISASVGNSEYKIVVLLPASLEENFINEIGKCGHDDLRNPHEKKWKFIGSTTVRTDAKKQNLHEKIVKSMKGYWIIENQSGTPFIQLSKEQQQQIITQIRSTSENIFKFYHYNGINLSQTNALIQTLETDKVFIIIDEVHNFISRVINRPSSHCAKIHDAICKSSKVKVLALSGTPFINYPREIAYLVNMVKGYDVVTKIDFEMKNPITQDAIIKALLKINSIDYIDTIDFNRKIIKLRKLPLGFVRTPNGTTKYNPEQRETFDDNIKKKLTTLGVNIISIKDDFVEVIPQDLDKFFNTFISDSGDNIKNHEILKTRMFGFASYFNFQNKDLFPTITSDTLVPCEMSAHQYTRYLEVRMQEIEKEDDAGRKAAMNILDAPGQKYKTFSRMACNFVFPKGKKRPYPSTMKEFSKMQTDELDDFGEDKGVAKSSNLDGESSKSQTASSYTSAIQRAIASILKNGNNILGTNLKQHSSKYDTAIQNILKSRGTVLVYSQFRKVEGLRLFTEALKVKGYVELKVKLNKNEQILEMNKEDINKPKFIMFMGDNTREETQVLLDIFNGNTNKLPTSIRNQLQELYPDNDLKNLYGNIAKVILITQSGAEGISLKNVRQVHILEPYWNNIRINQVIGRAIRTCSHNLLPPDERNVQIFRYYTTLPKNINNDKIKLKDENLSADELVMRIATKKTKLMEVLLDIIKVTSIDCLVSKPLHKDIQCFDPPGNDIIYKFDITLDEINTQLEKHQSPKEKGTTIKKAKKIVINNKEYLLFIETMDLIDHNYYKKGLYKHVGRLVQVTRNGKKGYIIKK